MTQPNDIAALLRMLKAAYPNFIPAEGFADIWYEFLRDLDFQDVRAAVSSLIGQARQFAPSIGEVRSEVTRLRAVAANLPSTYAAWEAVCKAPKDLWVRKPPVWDEAQQTWIIVRYPYQWPHELVENVARQLGWPNFPGDNEEVDRAHFFRAYEDAVKRSLVAAAEPPMVTAYVEGMKKDAPKLSPGDKQWLEDSSQAMTNTVQSIVHRTVKGMEK